MTVETAVVHLPYCSITLAEEVLRALRTRTFGQVQKELAKRSDYYKVLGFLRFMNLADENGRITMDGRRLAKRDDDLYRAELAAIARKAYKKLFLSLEGETLSHDNVFTFLSVTAAASQGKYAPEIATKVTRVFLWLCAEAGLEVDRQLKMRRAVVSSAPASGRPPLVALILTKEMAEMDQKTLNELFRKLTKALRDSGFSDS